MKRLKMFLTLFFISIIFTYYSPVKADTFTSVSGLGSTFYKSNSEKVGTYTFTNSTKIEVPSDQYFKFDRVNMKKTDFFPCTGDTKIYRVDFTLWGWYNQTKSIEDWIDYAQKISLYVGTDTQLNPQLLGSIVQPSNNGYEIKVTTFVSYDMLQSSDCGTGLHFDFNLSLLFGDKASDKYFLDVSHPNNDTRYYTLDNIYSITSIEKVNALLNSYYSGNLITQEKLDNISSSIENVTDKVSQTNVKLDTIISTLTDSSSPDLDGLGNANTWLPQGPVDSIIMLPLNFINTLINKIGSTCSPINLPIPFLENKFLTLPCVSTLFDQINGFSTLYNLIGIIGSVYLLYNYFIRFYKWVDDTLTLRENTWQDWGGD